MTGQELYFHFKQAVDTSFTGGVSPGKATRFLTRALDNVVDRIYRNRLSNQDSFDKIARLIVTGARFAPQNNVVFIRPVKVTCTVSIGVLLAVDTEEPHLLAGVAGDTITIYGLQDSTPAGLSPVAAMVNGITFTAGINLTVNTPTQLVLNLPFAATNTVVNGGGYMISGTANGSYVIKDYRHLLRAKITMKELLPVTFISASNTNPVKIQTSRVSSLRSKSLIYAESFTGNTAVNGRRYLKQLSQKIYALYSDKDLLIPVVGNGVALSMGTVYALYEREAKQKISDEKISAIAEAAIRDPYFEFSENKMKVLPSSACDAVEFDYIKKYPVTPDFTNTVDDLEIWFPLNFLFEVVLECCSLYGDAYREGDVIAISDKEISENQ